MRVKGLLIGGIALSGAAALFAGSRPWLNYMLEATHELGEITGHEANAALSPIAVALIAAALALSIAGKGLRRVLGVLVALLGAGIVALALTVLSDPLRPLSARIAEITGLTGSSALAELLWNDTTAMIWLCAAAGVLAVVLGVAVVLTAGSWAAGGRKYESGPRSSTEKSEVAEGDAPDRISDWDALSGGDDPSDDPSNDIR